MHLVRLALQPAEKTANAKPLPLPVTGPIGGAFNHPVLLRFVELAPGDVERNVVLRRQPEQIFLAVLEAFGLPGLDGAVAKRLAFVRNDQGQINANDPAESATGVAGAERRVE